MEPIAAHAHESVSNNLSVAPEEKQQPSHTSGSSCCELMCLSALPVVFAEIIPPIRPLSLHIKEASGVMADNAPPRLYRPPIS